MSKKWWPNPGDETLKNSFKCIASALYQAGESEAKWYHFNIKTRKNDRSANDRLIRSRLSPQNRESAWEQGYANILNCHFLVCACFFSLKTCLPATYSLLCNNVEGKVTYSTRLWRLLPPEIVLCWLRCLANVFNASNRNSLSAILYRWLDYSLEEGSGKKGWNGGRCQ